MQSPDGKYYKIDVANTKQLFRPIQSISSTKAEPFKLYIKDIFLENIDFSEKDKQKEIETDNFAIR